MNMRQFACRVSPVSLRLGRKEFLMISRTTNALCYVAAASCLAVASPAYGQAHGGHGGNSHAQNKSHGEPVNKMCPVGKEPIDGKTFAEYEGRTVGFCCPGCDKAFMKWDDKRRDAFVLAAMRGEEPGAQDAHAEDRGDDIKGDPYLLDTCPVSGQKLGSMGDPIMRTVDGREVRLCCSGCIDRIESNPAKYFAEVDKAIAMQQMPFYPLDTCIVTGEPLAIDGEDIAINHIYKNRLVRLCCKGCVGDFEAEPAKFLAELNGAVVKAQRDEYPLEDCAYLEGSKLGSMGDPVEIVVANRLVKFCCGGCQPKFEADPAKYIARIDAAWKPIHEAQGKLDGMQNYEGGHEGHGQGHGNHEHLDD